VVGLLRLAPIPSTSTATRSDTSGTWGSSANAVATRCSDVQRCSSTGRCSSAAPMRWACKCPAGCLGRAVAKRTHVDLFEWWQAGDRQTTISLDRLPASLDYRETDTGRLRRHVAATAQGPAYLAHDLDLTAAIADLMMAATRNGPRDIPASDTAPLASPVPPPRPCRRPRPRSPSGCGQGALLARHPDNTPEAPRPGGTRTGRFGLPWLGAEARRGPAANGIRQAVRRSECRGSSHPRRPPRGGAWPDETIHADQRTEQAFGPSFAASVARHQRSLGCPVDAAPGRLTPEQRPPTTVPPRQPAVRRKP